MAFKITLMDGKTREHATAETADDDAWEAYEKGELASIEDLMIKEKIDLKTLNKLACGRLTHKGCT